MATPEVRLYGFFRPGFTSESRLFYRLSEPPSGALSASASQLVEIRNARLIQSLADSEADFFSQSSFVLLPHISGVTEWGPESATDDRPNQISDIYLPEIESIIRHRLLPGRKLEIQQNSAVTRRGFGTASPVYGSGIHSDSGLTPEDFEQNIAAYATPKAAQHWRNRFDSDDVQGYMMLNFWRTTNMPGPLHHVPLAICDPTSVQMDDVLPIGLLDFTPTGKPTHQIALRQNPNQRWYWYPQMTGEELLAFKIFEYTKGAPPTGLKSCFHSAFTDPAAPKNAPPRQSCEHRVGVFLLRN